MNPVDGTYLYQLGKIMRPLRDLDGQSRYAETMPRCLLAQILLEEFISGSIYKSMIRIMEEPAQNLIAVLGRICDEAVKADQNKTLDFVGNHELPTALLEFETVFRAGFRTGNLFIASPKAAYDLQVLIFRGESLFPQPTFDELFPAAVPDVRAGARCLAFELCTASGFHFHRANEIVVREYLRELTDGTASPDRNLGAYIRSLGEAGAPDRIISCLRDLKNFHRNPLMHPDQTIETSDEAIALLNTIHTAVSAMMKEIRDRRNGTEVPDASAS